MKGCDGVDRMRLFPPVGMRTTRGHQYKIVTNGECRQNLFTQRGKMELTTIGSFCNCSDTLEGRLEVQKQKGAED